MVGMLALAGCATGTDAVATGGTFSFVSPGGKLQIFYDPPEDREKIAPMSGPNVLDPEVTVAVADYPGEVVLINLWGQWCGPCRAEIDDLPTETPSAAVRYVVLGTVLVEPVLLALRRLAQREASVARFPPAAPHV